MNKMNILQQSDMWNDSFRELLKDKPQHIIAKGDKCKKYCKLTKEEMKDNFVLLCKNSDLYELLPADVPKKFYLEINITTNDVEKEDLDVYAKKTIDILLKELKEMWKTLSDKEWDFVIFYCHDSDKRYFQVILPNLTFVEPNFAKVIYNNIMYHLDKKYPGELFFFDQGIYVSNYLRRLPVSSFNNLESPLSYHKYLIVTNEIVHTKELEQEYLDLEEKKRFIGILSETTQEKYDMSSVPLPVGLELSKEERQSGMFKLQRFKASICPVCIKLDPDHEKNGGHHTEDQIFIPDYENINLYCYRAPSYINQDDEESQIFVPWYHKDTGTKLCDERFYAN